MKRVGVGLTGLLVLIYLGYGSAMTLLHTRYIYPFSPEPFTAPGFQSHEIAVAGTTPLTVYVHQSARPDAPVVVYYMGNLGALGLFQTIFDLHIAHDRTIVAMTFRGGGGQAGVPSETGLKADALATFDALPQLVAPTHGPVFVQGYSLGTGLALHVAARRTFAGLILDAPYARLCEVMAARAWLPACLMPFVQKWDSLADATGLTMPVLIQQGTADQTIPVAQGMKVAAAIGAGGGQVWFQPLPGGLHNNLLDVPPYVAVLNGFIDSGKLPVE